MYQRSSYYPADDESSGYYCDVMEDGGLAVTIVGYNFYTFTTVTTSVIATVVSDIVCTTYPYRIPCMTDRSDRLQVTVLASCYLDCEIVPFYS